MTTDKETRAAFAADLIAYQFQMPQEQAERIVAAVNGVCLPPLEKEAAAQQKRAQALAKKCDDRSARLFQVMDKLAEFLESILLYTASIEPRRGHLIDVPVDDRASHQIRWLLEEWRQLGGRLLHTHERPVQVARPEPRWSGSATTTGSPLNYGGPRYTIDPR